MFYTNLSKIIQVIPTNPHVSVIKLTPNRFYSFENTTVKVTIINGGIYPIYDIHLIDNNNGLLIPYTDTVWTISTLNVSETKEFRYYAVGGKIGSLTLPQAIVNFTFQGYRLQANSSTVNVDVVEVAGKLSLTIPTPILVRAANTTVVPSMYIAPSMPTNTPTPIPTPKLFIPGFEGIFVIITILILVLRKKYEQ